MQIKKDTPSAVEAAMELTAVMAVSQIAQQEKKPETEVLKSFMNSNTAKCFSMTKRSSGTTALHMLHMNI